MTKKDYIAIAGKIRNCFNIPNTAKGEYARGARHGIIAVAESIADALAKDNPLFNRARFLTACGLED